MLCERYHRIKRGNLRGTARDRVETKSQSCQVNGSASGRNDVGPDLIQRYDVTALRGSEGESACDYDCQCCCQSTVEEFSGRRGCFHRIRGLIYWVEFKGGKQLDVQHNPTMHIGKCGIENRAPNEAIT